MKARILLLLPIALAGCRFGTLPDPNDPREVGLMRADVLQKRLRGVSDMLNRRQARGEISAEEAKELIARHAHELTQSIDPGQIPQDRAWQYGDVFITARRWQEAEKILEAAVARSSTEDRRVNDTLRLARARAEMGKVDSAITTARSVFDTSDRDCGPILPAVLFEIVPAGRGKRRDRELAALLEEAIAQHERVIVDPETEAGRSFLKAKPFHIRDAWQRAAQLYQQAGDDENARRAALRSIDTQNKTLRM